MVFMLLDTTWESKQKAGGVGSKESRSKDG